MNNRGARVFSRITDSRQSARFFSSVAAPSLPHINATMFSKISKPFQATLLEKIETEYRYNPICRPLLAQVDALLREQHFKVVISPSLEADQNHLKRWKTICGYEVYSKVLLLPSSPDALQHFYPETTYISKHPLYKNLDDKYLCMFLHEANHAHDFLTGGFKITKADAIALTARVPATDGLFADTSMRKFDRVLGASYSQDVMNQLKRVFRDDLIRLIEIAESNEHPDQRNAKKALVTIKASLMQYSVLEILLEFKSRFIEFSADGSLGAEFMQTMFPSVSNWYLHQHMPACQQALEQTINLRK